MIATREIKFETQKQIVQFLFEMYNAVDKFCVQCQDEAGTRFEATNLCGAAYLTTLLNSDTKITIHNITHNGMFPSWLNKYFVLQG